MSAEVQTCEIQHLIKLFNLTKERIHQLVKLGVVVKAARGKFKLWDSIRGYITYLQSARVNQWSGNDNNDPNAPETNVRRLKTVKEIRVLDLKIQRETGEMISRDEIREAGMRIGAALKSELDLLISDAGTLEGLDAATLTERLRARLNLLLERTNQRLTEVTENHEIKNTR